MAKSSYEIRGTRSSHERTVRAVVFTAASFTIWSIIGIWGMGNPRGDTVAGCGSTETAEFTALPVEQGGEQVLAEELTSQVRGAVNVALLNEEHGMYVLGKFHDEGFNANPIDALTDRLTGPAVTSVDEIQAGELFCRPVGTSAQLNFTHDGAVLMEQLGMYAPDFAP